MKGIIIMRQKLINTRSFVLPTILLGVLAVVPAVSVGVATNHSGTICKNYNASDSNLMDYYSYGTGSLKTSTTSVICPLTRNTSSGNGAYVYVNIKHTASNTTKCTAFSYSSTGNLLASASKTWSGSGTYEFALNLVGVGKSNSWSDYSVVCTIPGNMTGLIEGVDLSEL
ncbi:conserved hypothetical protein [Gammaproteobacteria bacterium]